MPKPSSYRRTGLIARRLGRPNLRQSDLVCLLPCIESKRSVPTFHGNKRLQGQTFLISKRQGV
jgi:hypothetical protein